MSISSTPAQYILILIDMVEGIVVKWPDKFGIATNVEEVKELFRGGKVALLLGMENGSPLEHSLANLAAAIMC